MDGLSRRVGRGLEKGNRTWSLLEEDKKKKEEKDRPLFPANAARAIKSDPMWAKWPDTVTLLRITKEEKGESHLQPIGRHHLVFFFSFSPFISTHHPHTINNLLVAPRLHQQPVYISTKHTMATAASTRVPLSARGKDMAMFIYFISHIPATMFMDLVPIYPSFLGPLIQPLLQFQGNFFIHTK